MNDAIAAMLKRFNQEHMLEHFELLTNDEARALEADLLSLDFETIAHLYRIYSGRNDKTQKKVLQEADLLSLDTCAESTKRKKMLAALGEDMLREGKVAVFLVAGGQGTRLGFPGPKGCYPISPIKKKSLFQLFAESIRAVQYRYGTPLHWFIMTSRENDQATRIFFKKHEFFGLNSETVHFFIQKQVPSLDLNGKLIVSPEKTVFKNPDGHGGSLYALHDSASLEHMAQRGIDEIFYFQVDNPLARIADPLFVGAHVEDRAEMSTKVVRKVEPDEKVGIIGRINGKLGCIEYSELSRQQAQERKADGTLRFGSANTAIHMINRSFAETISSNKGEQLPYHFAVKDIECLELRDNRHVPKKIKGIKGEMFIFDALSRARRSVTLEVPRDEEFSPVKNSSGADCPETAQRDMVRLHTRWIKNSVPDTHIPEDLVVEVSPLYALDEKNFRAKFNPPDEIPSLLYLA